MVSSTPGASLPGAPAGDSAPLAITVDRSPLQARRLEAALMRIERADGFPALSQQIEALTALLAHEDASVQQLANLVLKDYSLTLGVIRAANSFHYNRSGRPILSAAHAMVVMGVQAVRHIVSGLVLFEHYHGRSPGMKQLMLLSLLTANHAEETAEELGIANREEAYLCGMFRNLGEVLVASHLPREYAAILKRLHDRPTTEREAARQILGFDYDELAVAMVERWGLPSQVARVIRAGDPPADDLERVVAFSHALTTAVYRRDPASARACTNAVVQRYGPPLRLPPAQVRDILDAGLAETQSTFALMKVQLDDLRLRHQLEAALGEEPDTHAPPAARPGDGVTAAPAGESLADEVDDELQAPGTADLHRMLLMALEAVLRSGGFDRVLFALVSSDKRHLVGRVGLGTDVEALVGRFRCPLGAAGGAAGIALARRQELLLSVDWELRPDEASWLQAMDAQVAGVVPVFAKDVLVGCLYFDRRRTGAMPSEAALATVRRMRDGIGKAMAARRA